MASRPTVVAWLLASALAASVPTPLLGATQPSNSVACGSPHTVNGTLFLHRQELLRYPESDRLRTHDESSPVRSGDIALIEATPETLLSANTVDLAGRRITIDPGPDGFTISGGTLPAASPVEGLGLPIKLDDDDFAVVELPFSFPFYDAEYTRGFVHSDGNLTFAYPDSASTARSYDRAVLGPPRIAPLFRDLDPSKGGGVRMAVEGDRVRLTWHEVPLFANVGIGSRQTFQVVLESDGTIEFRYGHLDTTVGVVGIFPGLADRGAVPVDWSGSETTTVADQPILAEEFRDETGLDDVAVASTFYRDHEDAYDALVVFNDLGLRALSTALAYAHVVRNDIEGIGMPLTDEGAHFGSPRRLSMFVNMGAVSSYPGSPLAPISRAQNESLLTTLAHELGHRFLAHAPWRDPETGETSRALLGRAFAHWSFFLNSGASMLEGNAIRDLGPEASPRFETVAISQTFSELDLYLMGLIDPSNVGATFLVDDPVGGPGLHNPARRPEVGVRFDGIRKEVRVEDIVAAAGPRRPDASVSQRHFRYAFLLVVEDVHAPDPDSIRKLNRLRRYWRIFAGLHFGDRASSATELARMLHLTTWPAGGVLSGGTGTARALIAEPRDTDLTVSLTLRDPVATVPPTVVIPAGQVSTEFRITGLQPGTTTLTAMAADTGYDTAVTRLSVREGLAGLRLGSLHPEELPAIADGAVAHRLEYRVTDENRVPYSGVELEFMDGAASDGGLPDATTDFDGRASTEWQPSGEGGGRLLTARIRGQPEIQALTRAPAVSLPPALDSPGMVNAASGAGAPAGGGFAPGSLVTIHGARLAAMSVEAPALDSLGNPSLPYELGSTRVHVSGVAVPLVRAAPGWITLQLPFEVTGDAAQVIVRTPHGRSSPVTIPLSAVQPGIFPERVGGPPGGGGSAAASDGELPTAGGPLHVYATGLGAVSPPGRTGMPGHSDPPQLVVGATTASVDGRGIDVTSSKLASSEAGVYEVVLDLPDDLEPGSHTLTIAVDGIESNQVEFLSE